MTQKSSFLLDIGQDLSMMIGLPTITSWESKKRPQKPALGTFGFNTQTMSLEYWDGAHWLSSKMSKL